MNLLAKISLTRGLIPPDDEAGKIYGIGWHYHGKQDRPSLIELDLSAKLHRWPEMRKGQKDFFNDLYTHCTEAEKDMLKILKLPPIDTVRRAYLNDTQGESGKPFVFTDEMRAGLEVVQYDWLKAIAGRYATVKTMADISDKQAESEISSLEFFAKVAYAIALKYVYKWIIGVLPDDWTEDMITTLFPDSNEYYLGYMLREAGSRIKTELALKKFPQLFLKLIEMGRENAYPIDVGVALHKMIGEGQAWYWLRIARSEATLAANAAFNGMARVNNIPYEQWSAATTACTICASLHGHTWKVGDGPEPVTDTHPHCGCARIPLFEAGGQVEPPWSRPSPYDVPYTKPEIEALPPRRP